MVYTYNYSMHYVPSIPVVEPLLGRAKANPLLRLTALVDSGADATIIPARYLKQVRARKSRQAWMRGMSGQRASVDLYRVSLQLGEYKH
jgi:hypothetical protein